MSHSMAGTEAKEKFYGPLKHLARQYMPLLMARMRILEKRSHHAIEFLDAEADTLHEMVWTGTETERIAQVAEAQTDLHRAVLEAGTCQALVGAFIELLQEDYGKIRDSSCFFVDADGQYVSLYDGQQPDER